MSNLLMLVLCLGAGIALRGSGRVPADAHAAINGVIVHISLPALTLHYLRGFTFEPRYVTAVAMPWLLFALGAAVFYGLGRALRLPRRTVGALMLVGGFGNTSFVGLPMIESLYGRAGLPLGLLIDQLGSYLALGTFGVMVAAVHAGEGRKTPRQIAARVLTFPPLLAMIAALLLAPLPFPAALEAALARIGDTLTPLALLSVGLQLRLAALRDHAKALALGLGYKLLACPALALLLLWAVDAEPGMAGNVMVIEAAMPPMIGAGIVAAQAGLDPPLVSSMIGVGIVIAFCSAPAWSWVYRLAMT
jgi:malate permease and related proteins